jgi:GT2 family glycosyltransferase
MTALERHTSKPLISIVIVTWNCRAHTSNCLKTIQTNENIRFEVIVRDNGSEDGTLQTIQKDYPWVKLVGDGQNVGFSAANNEAINQAEGEYLLLLNPDTELPPHALLEFVDIARRNHDQAMIVPTLLNSDGTLQPSRHSFLTIWGNIRGILKVIRRWLSLKERQQELTVGWAIGACWFLPEKVYRRVGPLDANIFMYGEDMDYCWRIHQAGFPIVWAPHIKVIHHGNVSGIQKWGTRQLARANQGLIYFWMKHFGLLYTLAIIPIQMLLLLGWDVGDSIKAIRWRTAAHPLKRTLAFASACFDKGAWNFYLSSGRRDN